MSRRTLSFALAAALLSTSTGCGVFSALTNPKAAWALQEPAPMALILRRADAARATAAHLDRLMVSTAVDKDSKWIGKLALKKADVEAILKDVGGDPDYANVPKGQKLRVVPAEAWAKVLAELCPHESKFPSMFHAVNPEVGKSWGEVAGQSKTIAKLKADKENEQKVIDDKETSASDKEAHEKKKKEIEEQIDKTEQEYKPKVDAFMGKLRDEVAKAEPETKKQLASAMVNFKKAIEDARVANSVALLRYPMAMPAMPQELKMQAKRIVADVVEDKTGHRPVLDKFEPDIKLEGGAPKFTLNGLPPEAIAGIKPQELLEEVTKRAKDYVTKVLTLVAYVNETQEMLDLQSEVIKTSLSAMETDEGKVSGLAEDLGDMKVEMEEIAAANAAAVKAPGKGKGGKGVRRPVPMSACGEAPKADKDKKGKPADGKSGEKAEKEKAATPPAKKK
jgi:hypothetical protein